MAAESISCTTPRPQRSTSEPVTKQSSTTPAEQRCSMAEVRPTSSRVDADEATELVVILAILAVENGGADRAPGLPRERLDVPGVGVGNAEDVSGRQSCRSKNDARAGLLVLVHAVDTET